jgi:flagellar hook-associated protein 3 FlgL
MSGGMGISAPYNVADYLNGGAPIAAAEATRAQMQTLTEQVASGLISNTYAGLGGGAAVSLSLSPVLAQQQTWQNNINAVSGTMQVTQTVLTQISSIAANFVAQSNDLNNVTPSQIDTVAASARAALTQVASLLDSTDGGNYVFAGTDSANPPVPGPDTILSSGFFTQIQAAVGALGTAGAAATIASTLSTAASNAAGTSPFSTALSQPAAAVNALLPQVQVGDHNFVTSGIAASANASVASTGGSTTGSYMRDILRGLATIGSMSSSQASVAGFTTLVADTQTSLSGAVTALNQDAGVLGNTQSQLTQTQTLLSQTSTALQGQVSSAQDVDMAQTISAITQVQTHLQASYQLIANMQSMTLTKYLPVA